MKINTYNYLTILMATLLTSSLIITSASADNSHFDYLEVQFVQQNHNDVDFDNSFGIEGSATFYNNWYLTGNTSKSEFATDIGVEADYTNWFLGVGHYWSLNEDTEIYAQLSAETQKIKSAMTSNDQRGASIELGTIYQLNEPLSFTAHARFSDININSNEDRSQEFYFGGRIDYSLSQQFQIGLGYEIGEFDRLNLGLRFSF